MKARNMVCGLAAALLAAFAAGTANAAETKVVDNVLGPEGPLYIDGNLYYVGWISNTLSKWDGKQATVLNSTAGCGHNGLALTKRKTFLIACTNDPGAILETDLNGKQLHRWDTDASGGKFIGGINDIVVTANGGAYATIFGVFSERPGAVIGRILYFPPGGAQWREVAKDLNYANGIGVSPDQKKLYVSETVGNNILKFSINADGSLSHRANFALLSSLTKNQERFTLARTRQHEGRCQRQYLCGPVVRRQGAEDYLRTGKLLHVSSRSPPVRWHDQRGLQRGRQGAVRHGGEESRRPEGPGQRREDRQRRIAG